MPKPKWSTRAQAAFERCGLDATPTPYVVAKKLTAVDLLKCPNCGRGTVNQIAAILKQHGYELRIGRFRDPSAVW
jgi:hypothetical protein